MFWKWHLGNCSCKWHFGNCSCKWHLGRRKCQKPRLGGRRGEAPGRLSSALGPRWDQSSVPAWGRCALRKLLTLSHSSEPPCRAAPSPAILSHPAELLPGLFLSSPGTQQHSLPDSNQEGSLQMGRSHVQHGEEPKAGILHPSCGPGVAAGAGIVLSLSHTCPAQDQHSLQRTRKDSPAPS